MNVMCSTITQAFFATFLIATVSCDSSKSESYDSPSCADLEDRWTTLITSPGMGECTTQSDCIGVGGQPSTDPCNGYSTIGSCGEAVNATAYAASKGPGWEESFARQCPNHRAFDCGPAFAECVAGRCKVSHPGCSPRPRDAAIDQSAEVLFTPLDGGFVSQDAGDGG